MLNEAIVQYVHEQLAAGQPPAVLRTVLEKQGWAESDIAALLRMPGGEPPGSAEAAAHAATAADVRHARWGSALRILVWVIALCVLGAAAIVGISYATGLSIPGVPSATIHGWVSQLGVSL